MGIPKVANVISVISGKALASVGKETTAEKNAILTANHNFNLKYLNAYFFSLMSSS